jgi:hypothetical protein
MTPAQRAERELEDLQLVIKARNGDGGAMDTLIRRYTGFVRLKASSYFLAGGDSEDLIQEGLIGLYKAVRAYLEELGIPRHDVHYDLPRIRRLAVETIQGLADDELAARAGIPVAAVPAARGARDLREAAEYAAQVVEAPAPGPTESPETLERFRELAAEEPRTVVRELKAVGGDLRALRLALTGRERGPELAAILAALPHEEALRRVDQALQHTRS